MRRAHFPSSFAPSRRRLMLGIALGIGLAMPVPPVASGSETGAAASRPIQPGPFGDFDDDAPYASPAELRAMLGQVPGERCDISEKRRRDRQPVGYVSGLFRVNPPWPEEGALRLSFWEPEGLRLHLWSGPSGVTLAYHPRFHQVWAAYGTQRKGVEPRPAESALWATDGGRYRRVGVGTVEVHYGDGLVTLARGDVALLSVPMDGPPREVFLEANGQVRGLAMVPSMVVPEEPRARPVVLRVADPARLDWQTYPPEGLPEGVSLNKLPDGRVEFRAEERAKEAQAGVTVCEPGLHEYLFEVDDADPGTGVYLGSRDGRQVCRAGFFRHRETGRTVFGLLPAWQREIDRSGDLRHQVVPFAGRHQWLRVVVGAGVAKLWTSGDGVHWSQPAPAAMGVEGGFSTVGLYCLAHDRPRAIKLRRIEVRRLDALQSLVPEAVRERVEPRLASEGGALLKAKDVETWEQRVARSQSPDVEAEDWWRACALHTLAWGPGTSLGQPILDRLLDRALRRTFRLEQGLPILEEAALIYNSPDWPAVDRWTAHCERFGRTLARRGEPELFTAMSRATVCCPFWSERRLPAFSDALLRDELLTKVSEDRWPQVDELCGRLEYWARTQQDESPISRQARHLAEWGAAQAAEYVPQPGRDTPAGVPLRWRHPLLERLSREGYNVLAELDATLQAQAYREACQVISTTVGTEGLGLLPDGEDHRLWTSLPLAIERAMQKHPALRRTMKDEFGAMADLRVKQGIAAGDVRAVEAAALQFCGTHAAAEAHRWLGDRSLAGGRFDRASEHYRRALEGAPDDERGALLARLRLAGAMAGRDVGSPVGLPDDGPIEIGDRRLSAAQFEELIEQARSAHESSASSALGGNDRGVARAAPAQALLPGRYEARPWAHLDGRRVSRPSAMPEEGFDWAGRQVAVLLADRWMLVNNQLDQIAFDLATGREVWAQCRGVDERYQQWPLERMQPVLAQGRVFVRQLGDEGPELVALDAATGRLVWSSNPDGHVASDPLLLGDDLAALSVSYDPGEKLTLSLTRFDRETGVAVARVPLAEFRDRWQRRLPCRATIADGKIVATAGGCVLACDVSGRVSWLRRQIWVPPPSESYQHTSPWFEQIHDGPLVQEGRVFAAQPGVWTVECIELDTGQLVWRRRVGSLRRLVGLASGRLIARTADGLLAIDGRSGETAWHDGDEPPAQSRLLEAHLGGPPGTILACRRQREDESDERGRLVLQWIDAQTGRLRDETVLGAPEQCGPWLEPLVAHGGRQWAFVASPHDPASRDVLELVPVPNEPGTP